MTGALEDSLKDQARHLREKLREVEAQLEVYRQRRQPQTFGKLSASQPLLWTFNAPRPRNRRYGPWLD